MDPITIIAGLSQFAPLITKWLGAGKSVQEVADKAADIAKVVTGQGTTESAIDAMKSDPNLVAAYQNKILDQDMEYEKGYLADKANARARDVALSATPHGNVRANWLVGVAIAIIAAILTVILMTATLSEFQQGTVSMVLGMFLNELKNIYSFEFGTTRRSREKTDVLESITKS
jgi:hypothetical protein